MRRFEMGGSRGSGSWSARRDGSSYVVEVCPRTVFKMGIASNPSAIPIVQGIPAYDWVSGILVGRLHQVISWISTTITVNAMNVSLVDDDPSIVFSTGTAIGTVTFSGAVTPPAPKLHVAALTAPIGPMLEVNILPGTAAAGAGTVELALSVDLIGRTS